MNGAIVLALAAAISLVGVVFNSRTTTKATAATWIPFLWMLHATSKSLAYWLGGGINAGAIVVISDQDYAAGSPLDRSFLIVLMLAAAFILVVRRFDFATLRRRNKWVVVLFAYMAVSILWSRFPEISFKRLFRTVGDLVVMCVFLTEPEPFTSFKKTLRDLAYVAVPVSIVLIKYYRPIGVAYNYEGLLEMWVGVTTHKNELGQLAGIGAIALIHDILDFSARHRRLLNITFLLGCLWLIAGSSTATSKTSVVMFVFALCMLLLSRAGGGRTSRGRGLYYLSFATAFVPALLLLSIGARLMNSVVVMLGRDATLTGRTDLWNVLMGIAGESRLLGRGYGSFWIGDIGNDLWSIFGWLPTQGHNGYLDIYLELGLVGAALLGAGVLAIFRSLRTQLAVTYDDCILRLVFLAMVFLNNASESSLLRGNVFLWTVFLGVVMQYPMGCSREKGIPLSSPARSSLPGNGEPTGESLRSRRSHA